MKKIFLLVSFVFLAQCNTQKNPAPSSDRGVAAAKLFLDGSGYAYDKSDTSCDGFPKLRVQTLPGTCLGMALSHDKIKSGSKLLFSMPRVILALPQSTEDLKNNTENFLLTDMGSWNPNTGFLFHLKRIKNEIAIARIKTKLNLPHGLALSNDGFIYLGENQKITRFHFVNDQITDEELVIGNLAAEKGDMHPMTQFTFNPVNNDLYINSGAPTDHCAKSAGEPCAEQNTANAGASLLRIPGEWLTKIPAGGIILSEVAAQGLRNSMAMTISPNGEYLIQGENGRDFPEIEEPYEEMNLVRLRDDLRGFHYGWPYCYNFHATSPEWRYEENKNSAIRREHGEPIFDCNISKKKELMVYKRPHALIPPHAAPLHAAYYPESSNAMLSSLLGGQVLMSWHGYRTTGQRLVAYPVDKNGIPKIHQPTGNERFNSNPPSGCPVATPFNPKGGFNKHADYTEVISGWYPVKNIRPKGAPVGFTVAGDGSLWIVEDKNKTIVRLANTAAANHQDNCKVAPSEEIDTNIIFLAWRNVLQNNPAALAQYNYLKDHLYPPARGQNSPGKGYCVGCHEEFRNKELSGNEDHYTFMDFLVRRDWLKPKQPDNSPLYAAINHTGNYPPMPPSGMPVLKGDAVGEKIIKTVGEWINALPTDVEQSFAKIDMPKKLLNIREKPDAKAQRCGQFNLHDVVYIDPRPSSRIVSGGFTWSKVYMVPNHTHLYVGACKYPLDGVFYIAYAP